VSTKIYHFTSNTAISEYKVKDCMCSDNTCDQTHSHTTKTLYEYKWICQKKLQYKLFKLFHSKLKTVGCNQFYEKIYCKNSSAKLMKSQPFITTKCQNRYYIKY